MWTEIGIILALILANGLFEATSHAVLAVRVRREAVSPPPGHPGARAAAD